MNFDAWRDAADVGTVRFFSLGRHALAAALRAAGLGASDAVLMPDFICRDVLAAVHAVGATPLWYPVGPDLRPGSRPLDWPQARAVLAVNYFGFPQSLAPFEDYAARTGALMIEDNAHGFLSRDERGHWLGTRMPVGLFSLRKTLPLSDGAMLAIADERLGRRLGPQLAETGPGLARGVAVKARIKRLPVVGRLAATLLTDVVRQLRAGRTASGGTTSGSADEETMPIEAAPHAGLAAELGRFDVEAEIARRCRLYAEAEVAARKSGLSPLFDRLVPQVSPYGFPFCAGEGAALTAMRAWARAQGLDLIGWPDLPAAVAPTAPDWYRDVRLVNFL